MATNEDDGDAQMMSDDLDDEPENKTVSKSANNDNSDNEDNKEEEEKINLDQSFDLSTDEDEDDENEDQNQDDNEDNKHNEQNEKDKHNDASKHNKDSSGKHEFSDYKSKTSTDHSKSSHAGSNSSKGTNSEASTSAAARAEANRKKNQGTDNSSKELARKRKLEQMEEENKKMQVLMANFSEEQLNRYEIYRRSAFQKSTVKKIIQTVCGKTVSASVVIAMSGIAKVYVGEIVEKALDVKSKWNEPGAIQPKHLREAFRLFKDSNKLTASVKAKRPTLF